MSNDLIQLPEIDEIKELVATAKSDLEATLQEEPELAPQSKFILEVLQIIEEQISKEKNLNKLNSRDKISLAAHLNFLHVLLENFFYNDEFDDEDLEDEEDFDDEEDFEDEDEK